jgi:hypothetical protein
MIAGRGKTDELLKNIIPPSHGPQGLIESPFFYPGLGIGLCKKISR